MGFLKAGDARSNRVRCISGFWNVELYINTSKPRRDFKKMLGQANQFLVTILVGLSGVEDGLIEDAPSDLRAAWNPQNKKVSARRARVMVLEMALVRATDSLSAYLDQCRQKPFMIQDLDLQEQFDESRQSVSRKFKHIGDFCLRARPDLALKENHATLSALITVMIALRNRLVHSLEELEVDPILWERLRVQRKWISKEFRGLDVDRLADDFHRGSPPTFKEVASLIQATHRVVLLMDYSLLSVLNTQKYLKELILHDISGEGRRLKNNKAVLMKRLGSIWGRDISEREGKVHSYLYNLGASKDKQHQYAALVEASLVDQLSTMTPSELFEILPHGAAH
jgi:hypothetical protein